MSCTNQMMRRRLLRARFAARAASFAMLLVLAPGSVLASAPPAAASQEPTTKDLARVREQLAHAKSALARLQTLSVESRDRRELEARIRKTEEALSRYERLAQRGKPRERAESMIYTAGFAIVANDLSGIGTGDDVLLPILAVGALAVRLLTHAPPSVPELGKLWQEVTAAMTAVGEAAERIKQQAMAIPAREDCEEHLKRCLETPMSRPHSGRVWKHSTCSDCFEVCVRQRLWPDRGWDKKNCRWWEFWMTSLPEGSQDRGADHGPH